MSEHDVLQDNGLPMDAVFVAHRIPLNGEWIKTSSGQARQSFNNWDDTSVCIIRFPTYGIPLHLVNLIGRTLLGGNMQSAYGRVGPGQTFINADGDVMKIPSNSCTTTASFIRLEPLPKKRRVLVLELPIHSEAVEGGYITINGHTFIASRMGGTIKEVADVF